jgi:hypothetical protein
MEKYRRGSRAFPVWRLFHLRSIAKHPYRKIGPYATRVQTVMNFRVTAMIAVLVVAPGKFGFRRERRLKATRVLSTIRRQEKQLRIGGLS